MGVVKDRERAENWLIDWLDWLPADQRDDFTNTLAETFAAVRADERRAVVAWLRERAEFTFSVDPGYALGRAAELIERGEHAEGAAR